MKLIKLNGEYGIGQYAQVDDIYYEWLNEYVWYVRKSGNNLYASGRKKTGSRELVQMHRLVMRLTDPKVIIDHIDHNGLNNQEENLRIVTYSQNMANALKRKDGSSKYKGVYYGKVSNKMYWVARCYRIGKPKTARFYETEVEAAISYNEMAKEIHGEYACINVLTEEDSIEYKKILLFRESIKDKSFCSKCKQFLDKDLFKKGIPGKCKSDGCSSYCKKCSNEYQNEKRKLKREQCLIQQQNLKTI